MAGGRIRWYHKLCSLALQCGPIPYHVAFVMDGNRRFARQSNRQVLAGHADGYESLLNVLDYAANLGVKVISVYAFSVDNFHRPPSEVSGLMSLVEAKFADMLEHISVVHAHRARISVLGDLSRLPAPVQTAAVDVMERTAGHSGLHFNICLSYSSHLELVHATMRALAATGSTAGSVGDKNGSPSPVGTVESLSQYLYTHPFPPPDVIVRTSGEARLSDFLLWQSSASQLAFVTALWPEFGFADWVRVVLAYQERRNAQMKDAGEVEKAEKRAEEAWQRGEQAVAALYSGPTEVETIASSNESDVESEESSSSLMAAASAVVAVT